MTDAHPGRPSRIGATTLGDLVLALDSAVVELVEAPDGDDVEIASVALVDASDLTSDSDWPAAVPDLHLHVGITPEDAERWFARIARSAPQHKPRAVMRKAVAPALRAAARAAGIALVAVHPQARWDHVLPLVQRTLDRSRRSADPDLDAPDTDLVDLAQAIARDAGGMVSIEDTRSRVLAYSASDDTADELRTLSILGRQGPRDYLRALRDWGVFDRLRASDEVVDVPAHEELRTKRRLVVSIRHWPDGSRGAPALLGSIWLQQGDGPFAPDAAEVLRGAAALAARTIVRGLTAPSTEALLVHRLFGARGGGVDAPSLAGALNLPQTGKAAVIGFAANTPGPHDLTDTGSTLRLLAGAFRRDSLVTVIADRAYVLLPGYSTATAVTAWTRQLVREFETGRSVVLRAAIALPVPDLAHVAGARAEVDRVLDGTAGSPESRVTTLAESRTAVLLGEVLDLVARHPHLHDPRLAALHDYDRDHGTDLAHSTRSYLAHHGDTRAAATELNIHANTLRYRVRRTEAITGLSLTDPADRLLLELQLALRARSG